MNDEEMTVFSAKAAGITLPHYIDVADGEYAREWNPRDDDGDSFRLLCACGLGVIPGCDGWTDIILPSGCTSKYRQLSDATTSARHAVLMAAAEIGKAMP